MYWCSCAQLLVIQDRKSVLPKAFIRLTFGLSDVSKMALFTFYPVYEIFWVARYGVGNFSSFVSCKKNIFFDPQREKNKWGIVGGCIFLIPAGCWLEEFSCESVDTFFNQRSRELIEYLTKRGYSRTSLQWNAIRVRSIPRHATLVNRQDWPNTLCRILQPCASKTITC